MVGGNVVAIVAAVSEGEQAAGGQLGVFADAKFRGLRLRLLGADELRHHQHRQSDDAIRCPSFALLPFWPEAQKTHLHLLVEEAQQLPNGR